MPWLQSEPTFQTNRAKIRHEAEILACLAVIIQRHDYEFADDDTYSDLAEDLLRAANEIGSATDRADFPATRQAAGQAAKACSRCHQDYRG